MSETPRWLTDSLEDLEAYVTADLEDAERDRDNAYARVLELRGAVKVLQVLSTANLPNRQKEG